VRVKINIIVRESGWQSGNKLESYPTSLGLIPNRVKYHTKKIIKKE